MIKSLAVSYDSKYTNGLLDIKTWLYCFFNALMSINNSLNSDFKNENSESVNLLCNTRW